MAEVASAFVSLIPSFKGGKAAISKELDGAADSAGKSAGKKAGKGFGGSFVGGFGKLGVAMGAAFAAPVVIGGLNSLADKASDLNETINKSTVIFGKNAGAIDKWARGAATSMGLSRQQALEAAAGFGDMFTQIGFSGDQATKMSKSVVQMSADLGSFNNLPTDDVAQRLSAAFRGEYDSLQALVPNINAARVETEALAKTGKKSAKELTAQEKAAATLAIVQKDGARAMGDFAKTSDGAANKAKIQAARLEDLKTRAGQTLLPLKSLALDGFGKLITFGERLGPVFSRIGKVVGPVITKITSAFKYLFTDGADGAQSFAEIIDNVFGNSGKLVAPMRSVGQVIKDVINGFRAMFLAFKDGDVTSDGIVGVFERIGAFARAAIPAVRAFVTGTLLPLFAQAAAFITANVIPAVIGIVSAVRGFVAVALPIVQAFVAGMMARIQPMMPQIKAIFSTIGAIIVQVMGLIKAVIQRVTAIIQGIWSRWGRNIMDFVAAVFKNVLNIIGGALKIIQGVIKTVTSIIRGDWSGAWAGIKQIVSGAWQVIKGIVSGALTALKGIIRGGGTLLKGAMSFVGDKINEALSALAANMRGAGQRLIQGLIDGIKSKLEDVKRAASSAAQAIKDFFPGSPVKSGPLTSWNRGGAGKRLGGMLADGLTASQASVRSASRGLAASVATPGGSLAFAGGGSGIGGGGLSQSDVMRLAAAMSQVQVKANISAGSFDRAMGAGR